jgi:hypothetical protein
MRLETIRKSTVARNCPSNIIAEVIKENNLPEGILPGINEIIKW